MLPRLHPASTNLISRPSGWASLTTVRQDQARALVRAVGEWDLANADALATMIAEHETAGRRLVRLDISAVTFLDCACLEVLATAHVRLLASRGTLVLTGVTPRVSRLLKLAGLERVLLTTSLSDLDVHTGLRTADPTGAKVRSIRPATQLA